METKTEITNKIIGLKPITLFFAIFGLLSFTTPLIISGALIYFEFRTMQTQINNADALHSKDVIDIKALIIKGDDNTNERLNKKTGRNEDRLKQLERNNSDNK